jgi:hypothetical protein
MLVSASHPPTPSTHTHTHSHSYMERLGLWGPGAAFPNKLGEFVGVWVCGGGCGVAWCGLLNPSSCHVGAPACFLRHAPLSSRAPPETACLTALPPRHKNTHTRTPTHLDTTLDTTPRVCQTAEAGRHGCSGDGGDGAEGSGGLRQPHAQLDGEKVAYLCVCTVRARTLACRLVGGRQGFFLQSG